jgi:phosphomannomutase
VSKEGHLKISVSGVRGKFPRDLTPDIARRFSYAFSRLVGPREVFIGRDTRPSGKAMRGYVIQGLRAGGCRVVDIGIVPTPTALFAVREMIRSKRSTPKKKGGLLGGAIVITASHNPLPWNGFKFISPQGRFLNQKEADRLFKIYEKTKLPFSNSKTKGSVKHKKEILTNHIQRVLKSVDVPAIRKKAFRVAMDMGNGAGTVASPKLLRALGCKVFPLMGSPSGKFRSDPEPTTHNLNALCNLVKNKKADVGFAQDPDADRLAIVSERARPIGEENTLTIALDHILSKKQGPVVVNVSTSSMCENICKKYGAQLYQSRIGEANVSERMLRVGALIGGEGNGGVIYPAVNFGRDSLVAMVLVLDAMAKHDCQVEGLISRIPQKHMVKLKMAVHPGKLKRFFSKMKSRFKNNRIDFTDGMKVYFKEGWVHLRGSNTEPVLRLMGEAQTRSGARALVQKVRRILR